MIRICLKPSATCTSRYYMCHWPTFWSPMPLSWKLPWSQQLRTRAAMLGIWPFLIVTVDWSREDTLSKGPPVQWFFDLSKQDLKIMDTQWYNQYFPKFVVVCQACIAPYTSTLWAQFALNVMRTCASIFTIPYDEVTPTKSKRWTQRVDLQTHSPIIAF